MPDEKPVCSHPDCTRTRVVVFTIEDGQRRRRVCLCSEHDYHVREAMGWGEPAGARTRSSGQGLSTNRLRSLIKNDQQGS